jgi:hypothetical protein
MGIYRVQNVPDSSRFSHPRGYDSWIDFWEEHIQRPAEGCKEINCQKIAMDGGHVWVLKQVLNTKGTRNIEMKLNIYDMYIVPLCRTDNHPTNEDSYLVEGPLVNVNIDKFIHNYQLLLNSGIVDPIEFLTNNKMILW